MNALQIEKEQIRDIHYPTQISEKSADRQKELIAKCQRAMMLGNLHKVKCSIFFTDVEGLKKVNTTIWGLFDNHIALKGGLNLDLRYVEDIIF